VIIEKIKTAHWFLVRPNHWAQAVELAGRKLKPNHDRPELREQARAWAAERAVPVGEALAAVGLVPADGKELPRLTPEFLSEAERRAAGSKVKMGGPGDLDLLYAATSLSGAARVVETGVAYGWSSLAILAGLRAHPDARLVSVDMPYPKMGNEAFVGIVVPADLRARWELVREPDRNGLSKAIRKLGGKVDLCHYDSDKSWFGRQFGYRLMWDALVPGGVFISDDIQDNLAFKELVERKALPFAVTGYAGKFVGILRKPKV